MFASHEGGEGVAFFGGEPAGIFGAIGEEEESDEAQADGGEAFGEEEPLPVVEAQRALVGEVEDVAAEGIADDAGDGGGGEEHGGGGGHFLTGDPIGEVEDDAGEEAGFGDAQKEAEGVEGPDAFGE